MWARSGLLGHPLLKKTSDVGEERVVGVRMMDGGKLVW
jgi:hypothetical protein